MKATEVSWHYRSEFFLEWDTFQIWVLEEIKTYFMSNTFFSDNYAVCEIIKAAVDKQTIATVAVWCIQLAICMSEC